MRKTLLGLAIAAAAFSGLAAAPASAECYDIGIDECVNPCLTVYRAVYEATGKTLPGACTL